MSEPVKAVPVTDIEPIDFDIILPPDRPILLTGTGEKIGKTNALKIINTLADSGITLSAGNRITVLRKGNKIVGIRSYGKDTAKSFGELDDVSIFEYRGVGAGGKNPAFVRMDDRGITQTQTGVGVKDWVNAAGDAGKAGREGENNNSRPSKTKTRSNGRNPGALGGAYRDILANGGQVHHMPPKSVSPYTENEGPAIRMETEDHMQTESWGSKKSSVYYRKKLLELIQEGKFREAQQMEIDDVQMKFGDKYNEGIQQMVDYTDRLLKGE